MTKPLVLGVDIDDVVADFVGAFRLVVASELGVEAETLGPPMDWDGSDWGVRDRDHWDELCNTAVFDQRMLLSMSPIEGSIEALTNLHRKGVFVRFITARAAMLGRVPIVISDTIEWLCKHKFPIDDLCFTADKDQVGADLYIDDAPHNIERFQSAGHRAIIYSHGYNLQFKGPRVNSWAEVETYVHQEFPGRLS